MNPRTQEVTDNSDEEAFLFPLVEEEERTQEEDLASADPVTDVKGSTVSHLLHAPPELSAHAHSCLNSSESVFFFSRN